MQDAVRSYYDAFGEQEWLRLTRSSDGMLEFAITCHVLTRYLPPRGRVLDVGGGPGRYAIWLAQRGYRVVLADLSPTLIALAQTKVVAAGVTSQLDEITVADACDLSRWPDASFDAVLSLGPFYHLPDPADRDRAARELGRVLQPGGVAVVAFMPRYAFVRRTLAIPDERPHLAQPAWVEQLLTHGVFVNDRAGRFTGGYGVRPEEIAPFLASYGLIHRTIVSTESLVPDLQASLAELAAHDTATYQAALDVLLRTADDPGILGLANHVLYVGEKAASPAT